MRKIVISLVFMIVSSLAAVTRSLQPLQLGLYRRRKGGWVDVASAFIPTKGHKEWRRATATYSSSTSTTSAVVLPGHLYVVATPIGNLEDITIRALKVLQQVDVVCAEDTRHTTSLLRHHNLPFKKLLSHHEHSNNNEKIIELLRNGQSVALVSDAGTPGVNDPGASLAAACHQSSPCIPVHPIPGPSAVAAAVSVAGMGSVFTFIGFLPIRGVEREQRLKYVSSLRHTVVFFESPHRIQGTLQDLQQHLAPNRSVVICRELTKIYEEVVNCVDISHSIEFLNARDSRADHEGGGIKGEFTIVIGPATDDRTTLDIETEDSVKDGNSNKYEGCMVRLRELRDDGVTRSEAVKLLTSMYIDDAKVELGKMSKGGKSREKLRVQMTKSEIYKLALVIDGW